MLRTLYCLIVLSTAFVSPYAQAILCTKFILKYELESQGVKLSPRLVAKVKTLERQLGKEARQTVFTMYEYNDAEILLKDLKRSMNKRELLLWSWLARILGGDAKRIAEYKTSKERFEQLSALIAKDKDDDHFADRAVLESLNAYLKKIDRKFRRLRQSQNKMRITICKGGECLAAIEDALYEVDLSQARMHVAEAVGDLRAGSVKNSYDGAVTEHALEVHGLAEDFNKALSQVRNSLRSSHGLNTEGPNDSLHYVFNLYLNSDFDFRLDPIFANLFKNFELNEIRSQLKDLHANIRSLTEEVQKEYDDLKTDLDNQVCAVREMCR